MSSTPAPTRPAPPRLTERLVPLAIAMLALGLRLYHIGWGLPTVYEEAMPLKKAWDMWGFGPMREFDLNPRWFQYPSLVIYAQWLGQALLALALRASAAVRSFGELNLLYLTDPTAFYLVGRGITALFGAATVLPTWAFARRVGGPATAAIAALLVAVHPGLIGKSQVVEVDVPLVFFMTLGLARALAHAGPGTRRGWIFAGVVAGLAASAKYPGLVLVLPLALAAWWSTAPAAARTPRAAPSPARAGPRRRERARGQRVPAAPGPSRFVAWLERVGLVTLGLTAAFFVTSPFLFLDPATASRDLAIGRQLMTLGHFGIAAGAAYATYARSWFTGFLGAPLGIAGLAGMAYFALRRQRWALLLASLAVPFVLVVGSWQMKADRYLLPLVPVAAIAAAAALDALGSRAGRRLPVLGRAVPWLGALACALPLLAMLPAYWRTLGADTRDEARRWIESHLPAGALVASELYGPELLTPLKLLIADGNVLELVARRPGARPVYAVQTVPMFVVGPERAEKFYRLPLYADADAFVVTSSIRERYRGEPSRYATQLAFYDSLERSWPRVAHFEPHGGPGPVIDVFSNPGVAMPFAERRDPPPVDTTIATTDPLTGAEAFWYMNAGLGHEMAGHDRAAEECYRLALRFGASEPVEYSRVAMRLAGLLDAQGRRDDALRALDALARRAPARGVAASLLAAREELRAGRPICARVRP